MKVKRYSNFGLFVRNLGFLAFGIQCLVPQQSYAAVLVRSQNVSEAQLQVIIQKGQGAHSSFVENWRKLNPSQDRVQELQNVFEEAQRTLLATGSLAAKEQFEEVAEFALTADWKPAERNIIFQSIMRLASFEKDTKKREQLFERAASLDEDIQPNSELFDPKTLKEYQERRKGLLKQSLIWRPKLDPNYEVYVNGKRLKNIQKISLIPGLKRITIASNSTLPHTLVTDAKSLKSQKLELRPLVNGQCGSAKWNYPLAEGANFVAVLENDCLEYSNGQQGLINDSKTLMKAPVSPSAAGLRFPAEPKSESIMKKPLFWVVATAIVAGTVIVLQKNNQGSQSPTPTHSEGL